jgi:hypothetical protein
VDLKTKWLVAWERDGRRSWPLMVERFNTRVQRFPGYAAHDATGMGGQFIDDILTVQAIPIQLVGSERDAIFTEYITALERHEWIGPRIEYAWNEHRYVTNDDLYGKGHPPDSFIAGALAKRATPHQLGPIDLSGLSGPSILDGLR